MEPVGYRIGADENGLGARLGPLVVTAVLARVSPRGARSLARKLPQSFSAEVGDSKALVAHGNVALGEAWARAIAAPDARTPDELFARLSLADAAELREPCPEHVAGQCWSPSQERFVADQGLIARVAGQVRALADRGVELRTARTTTICVKRLNLARSRGENRFLVDLHGMERLVLALQREAGAQVVAICGKVGAMGDYPRFFGPLAGRLHAVLEQRKDCSAYRFPGLGELHFVQDADNRDPLVMLASLIGKYVRELLMARVARYYLGDAALPSGYGDPVTARFVDASAPTRRERRVPDECFERARAEHD